MMNANCFDCVCNCGQLIVQAVEELSVLLSLYQVNLKIQLQKYALVGNKSPVRVLFDVRVCASK